MSKKKLTRTQRITQKLRKSYVALLPLFILGVFLAYRGELILRTFGLDLVDTNPAKTVFRDYACEAPLEDHETTEGRKLPVYSVMHRDNILRQMDNGNLVDNPSFTAIDPDTKDPVGFYENDSTPITSYEVLTEQNKTFLRANQKAASDTTQASWLFEPVKADAGQSYGFAFSYRSLTPVTVTLEFIDASNKITYVGYAELPASQEWKVFAGSFDNTLHKASSFRFEASSPAVGHIDTADYRVSTIQKSQLDTGIVSVTFDDGWKSIYNDALPLFEKYSIRTTQFIVSDYTVNAQAGYMNLKDVKSLAKKGHEIASHSIRHCDLTKLNADNLAYEAETSRTALTKEGLHVNSFAHPYGKYSPDTIDALARQYSLLRSSDIGFNDRFFDRLNIRSQSVESTTTDEQFKQWLTYARENKLWVVLIYHRVNESGSFSATSSQLETQLKMIQDSGLRVLPLTEAAEHITGSDF